MLRKKYISTGSNPLSIDIINKNGLFETFDFRGGLNHPIFIAPSYVTKDEEKQKLLESHITFGISYVLLREEEVQPETGVSVVTEQQIVEPADEKFKTFKNAHEAKEWMVKELGVKMHTIKNKDLLMAKADELGLVLILESDTI